jgi:hypothetical protein
MLFRNFLEPFKPGIAYFQRYSARRYSVRALLQNPEVKQFIRPSTVGFGGMIDTMLMEPANKLPPFFFVAFVLRSNPSNTCKLIQLVVEIQLTETA